MKTIKKLLSLLTASAILCTAMLLCACGNDENTSSGETSSPEDITYKVTVKDALGNPYSAGVVVQFLQNGEQVALQPCDENGAVTKTMKAGDYDVKLAFTDKEQEYYYNEESLSLSADKAEIDVILAKKLTSEYETITAPDGEYDAYHIGSGCTFVELKQGQRNYFLFFPEKAGNYEFSVPEGENAVIGYYGGTHYVQEFSAATVTDNKFTISISEGNLGADANVKVAYVIGIDASDESAESCVIGIQRIGDPIKGIEDYPWTVYEKTVEISEYDLPEGAVIKEFDLTASTDTYNLVLNESDGFYHLDSADGPLVLMRLDERGDYVDCYGTILEKTGVVKYFFDDNGEFVKKENYSNCLLEYLECVDLDEGVYPLTEDLKYIVQQNGDHLGWWDTESNGYLFEDENGYPIPEINNEIAWLLMCCYIE